MPPRPLRSVYPKGASYEVSAFVIEQDPELATLVAKAIALWSIVESRLAGMLVTLLGGRARPAMAMFTALTSSQAQQAAIRAAASVVVDPKYKVTFEAVLLEVRKTAKKRHKLAHWLWGVCSTHKREIILIDPRSFVEFRVSVSELIESGGNALFAKRLPPQDGAWIYTKDDLNELIGEMAETQTMVSLLTAMSWSDGQKVAAERAFHSLSTMPRVQKALARLPGKTQKNPKPPNE